MGVSRDRNILKSADGAKVSLAVAYRVPGHVGVDGGGGSVPHPIDVLAMLDMFQWLGCRFNAFVISSD